MTYTELIAAADRNSAELIKSMPMNTWYYTIGKFRAQCARLEELGFLQRGPNPVRGMGFPAWKKIKDLDTEEYGDDKRERELERRPGVKLLQPILTP